MKGGLIEALMPYMACALGEEGILGRNFSSFSPRRGEAFLLLDSSKNVLFMSSQAELALSHSGVVRVAAGRLLLRHSGKQADLDSLIDQCFAQEYSGAISLMGKDRDPVRLRVSTVQSRDENLSPNHGLVVLFLGAGICEGGGEDDQFSQRFGLTESESKIANLISLGVRPADIADKMALSVHTVRHHVKKLYRKVGVHSQALTALVLGFPR